MTPRKPITHDREKAIILCDICFRETKHLAFLRLFPMEENICFTCRDDIIFLVKLKKDKYLHPDNYEL